MNLIVKFAHIFLAIIAVMGIKFMLNINDTLIKIIDFLIEECKNISREKSDLIEKINMLERENMILKEKNKLDF